MVEQLIIVNNGKYYYNGGNYHNVEVEVRELKDNSYKLIILNEKCGIIRDDKYVIAEPIYSRIHCDYNYSWNENLNIEEIKVRKFSYKINMTDASGKEYVIGGVIYKDGTVKQDDFYSNGMRGYTYTMPKRAEIIFSLYGYTFLCKEKFGKYGLFKFDHYPYPEELDISFTCRNEFKYESLLLSGTWPNVTLCLYKQLTFPKSCDWFFYSVLTNEFCHVSCLHDVQSIKSTSSPFFNWFQKDGYYGLLDPYFNVILPPIYKLHSDDEVEFVDNWNLIDYVVVCDKQGKFGVLQLIEKNKPVWEEKIEKISLQRNFCYEEFIPFDYKLIYRIGVFFMLIRFDGLQAIFSAAERDFVTPFIFSEAWAVFPPTIGEGLIGASFGKIGVDGVSYNMLDKVKFAFLSIQDGKVVLELPSRMITQGPFKNGKAPLLTVVGDHWAKFEIDKNGKLFAIDEPDYTNSKWYFENEDQNWDNWNPDNDVYSEDEEDSFYGMTDGMEGDLW